MSTALILVDHSGQSATATDAARALIEEALARGALIGQVRNADENDEAAEAQTALKSVRREIESSYRAAKDPLVQLERKLDATFRGLVEEIDREEARIGQLAGQFALAERRRVMAEEVAAREQLEKLEREKMQALAATSDPVKQSEVLENFSRRQAQELPLPSAPVRAEGQKIVTDWEIAVVNKIEFARWAFASGRWECLDIEVRKSAIKELLKGGMKTIPGLECKEVTKAGVRLPRAGKAIDV